MCRRIPGLGEPCGQASDVIYVDGECKDDLWCNRELGFCEAKAKQGEPCTEYGSTDTAGVTTPPCEDDLWCDSRDGVGTCRTLSKSGGLCLDHWDCEEPLACAPPPSGEGLGVCGEKIAQGGACGDNEDCAQGLGCADGVCAPLPTVGQTCLSGDCAPGISCESGNTCLLARYPGDTCTEENSVCMESLCRGTSCQTRARLGEACAEDNDCASGTCGAGGCIDPNDCLPSS
jgi:hypothetical protein